MKFLDYIPGASQRLPVNVSGQLQINPNPKGTHWPPLRPNKDYFWFRIYKSFNTYMDL